MTQRVRAASWLPLLILVSIAFLFSACSSDSNSGPTEDPPGPQVVIVDPDDLSSRVNPSQHVQVTFDQALDASQDLSLLIDLSSADVTTVSRPAADRIEVEHTAWGSGEEVTVTLSERIRGANGSQMGMPYVWTFWTESSEVQFLSSRPVHESTGVPINTQVFLLFSERMDLVSVNTEISVQNILPDPVGPQDIPFTAAHGEDDWIVLSFGSNLPSESTIRVTIPTTVVTENLSRPIAEQRFVSFVTGTAGDTTPPKLLSMEPANGSTISPNTPWIRFVFEEPINPESFQPSMLGAQLWLLLEYAPAGTQWSENFTVFTIPLPTPIPDGMPLRAVIDGYEDFAGNPATEGFDYSIQVTGQADYYPFVDGLRFTFQTKSYWDDGGGEMGPEFSVDYEELRRESAEVWNRVEYDEEFVVDFGWDVLGRTSEAVLLQGFVDRDDGALVETTLTPVVDWLKLPPSAQQWSGTSTASNSGGSRTIEYTAELVRQEDLPLYPEGLQGPELRGWLDPQKRAEEPEILWLDCWMWTLDFAMMEGETTVQTGADTLWYAAAVGVVWGRNREVETNTGYWEWTQSYLSGFEFPGLSSSED